jgi:hypothetical protein
VPALDGTLAGESYSLSASAVTGDYGSLPESVVTRILTTNSTTPVTIGGFLPLPTFQSPGTSPWNGTHVAIGASGTINLAEISISSGGGLISWTIITPGTLSFDLPDLTKIPGNFARPMHGSLTTFAAIARIDGFDYGNLTYGQLQTSAWNAYAMDYTTTGIY